VAKVRQGGRPRSGRASGEATSAPPARPVALKPRQPRARQQGRRAAGGPTLPELSVDPAVEERASAWWVFPLVIGLLIALRLGHLVRLYDSPFAFSLVLDARAYDEWARQIAAGAWVGQDAFWVDPLYAYFLGAIYRVTGHGLLLPRLANMTFGVLTAIFAARIAWRCWGSRLAAVLTALMFGIFVPAIHFEGQIEKTALSVFLLVAGVDLFLIGTTGAILGAGLVAGLATLARGNTLLLLPLTAIVLALGWDRERGDPQVATSRERLGRAALFLAAALPLISLATLHNYLATGELVPTTTNLGINLYLGNHPENAYGYYDPPDFLHPSTSRELPDFHAEATRRAGRKFTDRTLSDYWAGQTWEAIEADPGLAIARVVHKLQLALNRDEVPDSDDVALVAQWSPVLRSPILWFGQLLPLALLGAFVGWRRRPVQVVLVVAATYVLSLLPFFVMARLRVQLVPFLAVLGSGAVVWILTMLRGRQRRPLLIAAAILVAGLCVTFYTPDWMAKRRTSSLAIGWHNIGASLADQGRTEEAVRAYERAVEIDATAVPAALRVLGKIYQQRGEYQRAEAMMGKVVEIRPDSPSAREALRGLYDVMLADTRWSDDPEIRRRRQALGPGGRPAPAPPPSNPAAVMAQARSFGSKGQFDQAIAVLQQAVRQGPYDEDLHYMLGQAMERHATPEAMIEFFSREVDRDEKPQTSHYYWAVGLERKGDMEGAVSHLQKALEIDPAHEMSQWRWGVLLDRQGRSEEALEHLQEAVEIHSDYKNALEDAARVADKLGRSAEAESYRKQLASADPGSPRRFLHWATYLHEHGRDRAAWDEIHHYLEERPNDPEGTKLRDEIRAALGDAVPAPPAKAEPVDVAAAPAAAGTWKLAPERRTAFIGALAGPPPGTPAWIAYDPRDADAHSLAQDLASAFREAGWTVRRMSEIPFAIRAGIFIMAADDPPTDAATAATNALAAAGLNATVGTGYREYSAERRRSDPSWVGFDLAPEQEFVVAVGRKPAS
jgi:tetratricopeptide (TPR) repeat protein